MIPEYIFVIAGFVLLVLAFEAFIEVDDCVHILGWAGFILGIMAMLEAYAIVGILWGVFWCICDLAGMMLFLFLLLILTYAIIIGLVCLLKI